ncbi:MAG: 5-formyltetrahydrofolate cyclo-ligase [Granulosicoccus sp.]|nr:5-formyltetrahydrofolate cyclo-ligase [Granulosicoccus sp.]
MTPSHPTEQVTSAERQRLRQRLRRARDEIDPLTVAGNSSIISAQLLPLLSTARTIAGYLAIGSEVHLDDTLARCRERGQITCVPITRPDHTLLFTPFDSATTLTVNRFGIREPVFDEQSCLSATSLDAVIVPLVGFDRHCHRIGMGGGYYDRTFAQPVGGRARATEKQALLIGVAHEVQYVEQLVPDWWDVPLDVVVTERRIVYRQ